MITLKGMLIDHLVYTYEKEAWQPPLRIAVWGLTAREAAWKPSPDRHSIWQIVRHVIHWKRGVLESWAGDPPDFERMTREDWPEVQGDQAAWEDDVAELQQIYAEFRRRLEALDEEGLQGGIRAYRQSPQPQLLALRLMRAFTHDIYHAGQIRYLRALQEIPGDRFFTAAWDGDVARLAELLETHPELLIAFNEDGWTALQIASYAGQAGAARFLLDRGADLEAVSRNEMANTALHGGVTGWQTDKRAEVVSLLLDRGADTGAGDATGSTPLHLAVSAGRPEIVELLLRRGAPVNARRGDGQTPLGRAVREEHTAVAEALRRSGGEE